MSRRRCWPWAHVWHYRIWWMIPYKQCGICGRTILFE